MQNEYFKDTGYFVLPRYNNCKVSIEGKLGKTFVKNYN